MTDKPAANDTAAVQPEGEAPVAAAAPELVPAEQVTAALEAAAEFKDKHLRLLAEMENLRRRTEKEVADARQYGIAGFARDVLAVADNMHRALAAIDEELRGTANDKMTSLIEGVELTERELLKALEKSGVKKFTPQGEKFDPNLHQAMYEVPDSSVPSGTVVQVVQGGYVIGERILRPALVAVAKGGAKTTAAQDN
jgi:molecular chaperone GrpE